MHFWCMKHPKPQQLPHWKCWRSFVVPRACINSVLLCSLPSPAGMVDVTIIRVMLYCPVLHHVERLGARGFKTPKTGWEGMTPYMCSPPSSVDCTRLTKLSSSSIPATSSQPQQTADKATRCIWPAALHTPVTVLATGA